MYGLVRLNSGTILQMLTSSTVLIGLGHQRACNIRGTRRGVLIGSR